MKSTFVELEHSLNGAIAPFFKLKQIGKEGLPTGSHTRKI